MLALHPGHALPDNMDEPAGSKPQGLREALGERVQTRRYQAAVALMRCGCVLDAVLPCSQNANKAKREHHRSTARLGPPRSLTSAEVGCWIWTSVQELKTQALASFGVRRGVPAAVIRCASRKAAVASWARRNISRSSSRPIIGNGDRHAPGTQRRTDSRSTPQNESAGVWYKPCWFEAGWRSALTVVPYTGTSRREGRLALADV